MVQHGEEAGPKEAPRRPIYKDLVLLKLAALVFLADQLTKAVVRASLELRESFPAEGFFRFTHTFNTGSVFGLFQDQNLILTVVSFAGVGVLALIYRSQRRPSNLLRMSLGLQFGGACGNVLDRVRLGHVTDFVDVGPWPIFNVADASIVVGLVLLGWMFLAPGSRNKTEPGSETAITDTGGPGPVSAVAEELGVARPPAPADDTVGRPGDAAGGPPPDPSAEGRTPEQLSPPREQGPGAGRRSRPEPEE